MTNYSKQRYIVAIWALGRFSAFRDLWKTTSENDTGQDFAQIEKRAHVPIHLQFYRTEVETFLDCKADETVYLWFMNAFSSKTGKIRISRTLKKLHTSLWINNSERLFEVVFSALSTHTHTLGTHTHTYPGEKNPRYRCWVVEFGVLHVKTRKKTQHLEMLRSVENVEFFYIRPKPQHSQQSSTFWNVELFPLFLQ